MSTPGRSFFRSEEMSLCQIYVKKDAAYSCICELGELGLVQFNNLNEDENILKLRYVQQISHCAEMQRILRYMRQQVEEAGIEIPEVEEDNIPRAPRSKDVLGEMSLLEKLETELLEITRNYAALRHEYFSLLETNKVLEKADEFFLDSSIVAWSDSLTKTLLVDTNDFRGARQKREEGLKLGYLTGTIPIENFFAFERVLWRVCRGNFFIRQAAVEEDFQQVKKFVFMVFFQGDVMERNIRKICQGFQTALYQCPESSQERIKQLEAMEQKIKDLQIVLEQTDYHRRRVLTVAAADLSLWWVKIKKVTAVYYILNHLGTADGDKYLIAECWVPTLEIPLIQQVLYRGAVKSDTSVPPILAQVNKQSRIPPTYNRTNRFTYGFQVIVDAYGVSDYRELNPAPFTIVTFPFLFGVMFGDIGHGVLISIFASWMVFSEKKLTKQKIKNEIWNIIFGGRYIILAMGLFSIYAGFIYNDIFSRSLKIFECGWKVQYNESTVMSNHDLQLNPSTAFGEIPHIFGIDPIWHASGQNAIITMNSIKMKVAIILGVLHMFFGMALAARNHVFFGNYVDLIGVCFPQMIFFCLFLYLAFLMFFKWISFSAKNQTPYDTHCAPSILIVFIDMVLFKNSPLINENCERYMFEGQERIQISLVITAVACIPIMLLVKPLYILWMKKEHGPKEMRRLLKPSREKRVTFTKRNEGSDTDLTVRIEETDDEYYDYTSSNTSSYNNSNDTDDDTPKVQWHEHDMSEVFIHQGIHTIESVLGSVSHTASYLRLWALSLAHGQLSGVLWEMILSKGLQIDDWKGSFFLVFTFSVWSMLTLSILVVMEGLSAFLHTLRLHWVEFQSKFYSGTGTTFQPFDFKKVLEVDDDDD